MHSGIDLALARGIGLARTMTTQDVLFNHLSSTSSLLPDNFSTIEPPAEASSPLSSSSSAESDSPPIYIQPSSSSKPAISSLQTLLVAATAPSLSSSSSSPSAPLHAQLSHSHLNITRVLTASSSTQLAVFLNDPERRRDPWNLALPTEILQFGGATTNSGSEHAPADNMTRRGSSHSSKWTFLVQKSWGPTAPSLSGALSAGGSVNPIADPSLASSTADSAEGLYYYRPWNDPPLRTIRDVFDFVQQLLEGLVFFHENSLTRIPFTPSNIVMDTGLALDPDLDWDPDGDDEELRYRSRRDTSATDSNMEGAELDRAAFPVKYYLARMEGVRFVAPLDSRDATTRPMTSSDQHEGRKDDHENLDEYAEDIVRLGKLIKELFASIVDDPLKLLYEFMLSAATPTSASPLSPLSPAASSLSSSPLFASSPLPQSSSPLHPQNAIKASSSRTSFTHRLLRPP
ncbi:hypothetical protein DL93DRAFT_2156147 [Clavulina sp. PMI_390]|nr:hypothetical protein DL93DRAFT_2156147 [Clavulina sp. PMI_390]